MNFTFRFHPPPTPSMSKHELSSNIIGVGGSPSWIKSTYGRMIMSKNCEWNGKNYRPNETTRGSKPRLGHVWRNEENQLKLENIRNMQTFFRLGPSHVIDYGRLRLIGKSENSHLWNHIGIKLDSSSSSFWS